MVDTLTRLGREAFADAAVDWNTDTIKAALVDLATGETAVKAITGATNATPIVVTATAHGFSNGDFVVVINVGGNLAANGLWKVANVAANTFELTDPITGTNVAGSAAYTSGGHAICLGAVSTVGKFYSDWDGMLSGTAQTLTSPTLVGGVLDAADPSFASIANLTRGCILFFKDTGTASTSRVVGILTGRQVVTCAVTTNSGATSLPVERLRAGIANGTVLHFSNGATATLTAAANAGDRTLTVSSTAATITAGNRAECGVNGAGLPLNIGSTPVTVSVTFDNGDNKIFVI